MKVLLTGATGYIGKRLLPVLVERGYYVICCVRDKDKFHPEESIKGKIEIIEVDLNKEKTLKNIPEDIDFAYYLVHSMSNSRNYDELEKKSAINFREHLNETAIKQVIYLSGIVNSQTLSKHLNSRQNVEVELSKGKYALTTARDREIIELLDLHPLSYKDFVSQAFKKIEQNEIVSSWIDSTVSGRLDFKISDYITVPQFGCYKDSRKRQTADISTCIEKIWRIGGETGWYYADWLWKLRGFIDKVFGGVGLRRGRTNVNIIMAGDTLDFWRVLFASKEEKRLLLFAEMKLPGEAWLEFKVIDDTLFQTATFRPKGLSGRLYWYAVLPFHAIVFRGLINKLANYTDVPGFTILLV